MSYPSIRIEGSILTGDIVEAIALGSRQDGQRAQDFGFPTGTAVKDEIADAWASARAFWSASVSRIDRLREGASGVTETRNLWITPLLGLLGYTCELAGKGEAINGKNYAISHRDTSRDSLPIHIMGWHDSLDRRRQESGPRMSPHALVQEYINLTEHLYAIVTNGRQLRLLRDSSRLVKLSFLEFDLERIFNEELFADFAVLFRLLHASRMPVRQDAANESVIERYHQDALESGSRIREGLSGAVEQCIRDLANGFLAEEQNEMLRRELSATEDSASEFYQHLLRLIYRMLFLMVIEERGLVYPLDVDPRLRQIYERYYSIGRLRRLAEKRHFAEEKYHDAWEAVCSTFRLFEDPALGEKLGISPLGSLFHRESIGKLANCRISNAVLLTALRRLSYFQHPDTRQYLRVNYGALNVEEFGSVYEGLLEFDAVITEPAPGCYEFHLAKGNERSNTGSHYTPDELVQPLIKHSLDYLIADKLKEADKEAALLSLRVADIACGSGHILLAAARRIGTELAIVRTGEDQPSPSALRQAIRDVIRECIYGVDLNPLAVELCKVALWLEAHVPGRPLNFLDHHIKCGNAIVGFVRQEELEKGVPDEAFKTLPDDDKELAAEFRRRNKKERQSDKRQAKLTLSPALQKQLDDMLERWNDLSGLPERTPAEIELKKKRFSEFTASKNAWLLEQIACIPIAQFYVPKTLDHKSCIITDEDYREFLSGRRAPQGQATAHAWAIAHRKKFFHWFLQFPEITQRGGFDCILGNPPYLGGQMLSGRYGDQFLSLIKAYYSPAGGWVDLVAYFFRRAASLVCEGGFCSFITTNSISQGDTREAALGQIIDSFKIIYAQTSILWPGRAAVRVTLLSFEKSAKRRYCELNGKEVSQISSSLNYDETESPPLRLKSNKNLCFKGFEPNGSGFIISSDEASRLLIDSANSRFIFKYITGKDITSSPNLDTKRWIIYTDEISEDELIHYGEIYTILNRRVKPERLKKGPRKYPRMYNEWWKFWINKRELRDYLCNNQKVFCQCRTTKTHAFEVFETSVIPSTEVISVLSGCFGLFGLLQSSLHEAWAWRYCSTFKGDRRYSPTDCFENYPFAHSKSMPSIAEVGERYHGHRRAIMVLLWLGLTKIYNIFHDPKLTPEKVAQVSGQPADIAQQGYDALLKLRDLHRELDQAVLAAYGWTDIDLGHDFHDLDYLPENDRTRYTISPAARREVLQRLLKLNHERHAEEKAAATSSKAKKPSRKRSKRVVNIQEDDLFTIAARQVAELPNLPGSRREILPEDDYLLELLPAIIFQSEGSRISWNTLVDVLRILARPQKLKNAAVGEDFELVQRWEQAGRQQFKLSEVLPVIEEIGGENLAIESSGGDRFLSLKTRWPSPSDWPAYDAWLALRIVKTSQVAIPFEAEETHLLEGLNQLEAQLA